MKRLYRTLILMLLICMTAIPVSAVTKDKVIISIYQDYKAAQEVLKLVNKERTKRGLNTLKMDKTLTKHAVTRAAELCVMVPMGSPHMRPDGTQNNGTHSIVYECCLESSSYETAKEAVDSWMDSPSHKAGILLPSAKSIGVACTISNGCGNFVLEFSNQPAKSVEKSKSGKNMDVTITALRKYLPKKAFSLSVFRLDPDFSLRPTIKAPYAFFKYRLSTKGFKFESSNPAIASVSKDGKLNLKAAGTVTFTATLKARPTIKVRTTCTVLEPDEFTPYYTTEE